MYRPVKLTKKTATELIRRFSPARNIERYNTVPEVAIFRVFTSEDGVEIRCENDWYNHNGRIKVTISDHWGAGSIQMFFNPDTLDRDFEAEEVERKSEKAAEADKVMRHFVGEFTRTRAQRLTEKSPDEITAVVHALKDAFDALSLDESEVLRSNALPTEGVHVPPEKEVDQ